MECGRLSLFYGTLTQWIKCYDYDYSIAMSLLLDTILFFSADIILALPWPNNSEAKINFFSQPTRIKWPTYNKASFFNNRATMRAFKLLLRMWKKLRDINLNFLTFVNLFFYGVTKLHKNPPLSSPQATTVIHLKNGFLKYFVNAVVVWKGKTCRHKSFVKMPRGRFLH